MRKTETLFLTAVMLFALLFTAVTVLHSADILATRAAARHAAPGTAGESRDVDLERMERLIRQQHLSDHEASFYTPVDGPSEKPPEPAPPDRPDSR